MSVVKTIILLAHSAVQNKQIMHEFGKFVDEEGCLFKFLQFLQNYFGLAPNDTFSSVIED